MSPFPNGSTYSQEDRIADSVPVASEAERRRHSLRYGYTPSDPLIIDQSVRFHTEAATDLDPISYEVIRSKLWNLNLDHGETIRRVSGSTIVVEGHDYNASVMTETGDGAVFGPSMIMFAGLGDLCVKWTLEHRSGSVGIHDGDIFIQDDPWVGANHQMDAAVYGPLFVDGYLFAWIYNCLHQREVGGATPGGFVQDAVDVFTEPTFFPPLKLAERGLVREDIVDAWSRRSRLPDVNVLEIKSQLAGFNMAHRRLKELVERYGPATVKGTMRRMIDSTASAVGRRLSRLPDGVWRDEKYVAGAAQDDRKLYRICLSFEKRADRLIVSNHGTDPAVGSLNCSSAVLRAAVLNGVMPTLAYDQYMCGAGVLRQMDFDYDLGTITSAIHPSAVSTSLGLILALTQANYLTAKMVSGDSELGRHAMSASAGHTICHNGAFGIDQYGDYYSDMTLDTMGGGVGAFSFRDGIDHGGTIAGSSNPISDVEKAERTMPLLYLFRKELSGSGAHGQWRGGAALSAGLVGHKTAHSFIGSGGLLKSVTQGIGVCGGYPATGGYQWYAMDTKVRQWLASGRIPTSPEAFRELAPDGGLAPPKGTANRLEEDDLFEIVPNPGAGWGDPLLRDPVLVESDVHTGRFPSSEAWRIYGVVLMESGAVDSGGTTARRATLRSERLLAAMTPRKPCDGRVEPEGLVRLIATIAISPAEGQSLLCCSCCGQILGDGESGYRWGCAELDQALPSISDHYVDPQQEIDGVLALRQCLCPSCGSAVDAYICQQDDVPFADTTLIVDG